MVTNKRFIILMLVVVLVMGLFSTTATAQDEMLDAHKAAIQQLVDEALNGNVDVADTIFATDSITHDADGTTYTSTEDFETFVPAMHAAIPDFHAEIEALIAEGEYAAFRLHMTGTFENELVMEELAVPPTGQPVSFHINIITRFNEEGLIVEEWDGFDNVDFLTQIGLFPAPEGAEMPMVGEAMANEMMGAGMEADYAAGVQAAFDLINAGDIEGAAGLLAPDYTHSNPNGVTTDTAAWTASLAGFHAAFPDLTLTANVIVAEGDYVMTALTISGTHTADMMLPDGSALPPTNASLELPAIMLTHFNADGLPDYSWEEFDQLTFLGQLGLLSME
jgi:predicted ester cyclase